MTVHGAKGLEFERVLLTGMEEEMFPYKGVDPGESDELEEERRLAYVAITRARKQLVMLHTQTRQIFGTTRWNRPSRFLGELPKEPPTVAHQATARSPPARSVGSSTARTMPAAVIDARLRRGDAQPWRRPSSRPSASGGRRRATAVRRPRVLRRPDRGRDRELVPARRAGDARPLRRGAR